MSRLCIRTKIENRAGTVRSRRQDSDGDNLRRTDDVGDVARLTNRYYVFDVLFVVLKTACRFHNYAMSTGLK